MLNSLIIAITFITIIPLPSRLIPEWNSRNLRYFCLMLPVTGLIFSLLWLICFQVLAMIPTVSSILRGFMMMTFTLLLTGGLHLDGLMDTCDAIFSHRDRETRLKILSDTHAGSFAVMGCMVIMIAKTLLFSELFRLSANISSIALIPIYSRLGMGVLLNNLPFAKSDGLAVMLGSSRNRLDNFTFLAIFIALSIVSIKIIPAMMILCLVLHVVICKKIFGGITGDLLGAFVEASEVIMLTGMVISGCI
ncbi:MAG: adenosylcobinamide-GDP ribazoletransferase [Synergistaceae bacterium]|nr:adenosylcobinamide-GDP ribazoletransferase [Synergistaceae bacterium]MBQ3399669.1 adenosylcobinamide-GDP ribazoletransferase [Synergistaceae bacterium]MBQ3760050.1 adenosylcobinamide-GDP ribazoletransferase [Synergistaceae bacterium]MBQ4402352.1 adenosylcobinamide-GDP ribazoletransferase [Synergistaceae bacterium]MBQ6001487.1 adenosylcobinamide-GDP ribazoletransferase [Synergistaceae bacterium]